MDANPQRQKRQDTVPSLLNMAIEAMNLAKEVSNMTPAKAVFGSVGILLTMIRVCFLPFSNVLAQFIRGQDSMANKSDYVELGLACADVCKALDRGMNGKKPDDLNQSVREAINQLTTWVEPAIYSLGSTLIMFLIVERSRRSKGRSSNRVGGTQSLEFCKRRMTRIRLWLGSWTLAGSFRSSMCVQSFSFDSR